MNNMPFNQKLAIAVAVLSFLAASSTQMVDFLTPLVASAAVATTVIKSFTALCTMAAGAGGTVLAFFTSKQNVVNDVVAMAKDPTSPVQGVVTTNTDEGKALAASIPGPIFSAGSDKAVEVAKS